MNDLIGMTTKEGWLVQSAATFSTDHTGGYFSSCFNVNRGGQKAFLKALNLDKFDLRSLVGHMSEFQYEQETLEICRDSRMHRVVRLLESGELSRDTSFPPIQRTVPIIVFELADEDIRSSVDVSKDVPTSWRFVVLHQHVQCERGGVATGIRCHPGKRSNHEVAINKAVAIVETFHLDMHR